MVHFMLALNSLCTINIYMSLNLSRYGITHFTRERGWCLAWQLCWIPLADPEHFQSSFFASFGANTFQWQVGSNRIPFQWQIESTIAAKVTLRTKKSCSPKIGGFNRNSQDVFFSRVTSSPLASGLPSSSNHHATASASASSVHKGKIDAARLLKQLKLGIKQRWVPLWWRMDAHGVEHIFFSLPAYEKAEETIIKGGVGHHRDRERGNRMQGSRRFWSARSKECREIPVPVTLRHYAPAGAGAFQRQFRSTCSSREQPSLQWSSATAPYMPLEFNVRFNAPMPSYQWLRAATEYKAPSMSTIKDRSWCPPSHCWSLGNDDLKSLTVARNVS